MEGKNILICLEKIGIGGVETYAINQAIALKNKGYGVVCVSKDGIHRKTLENNGIKWVEFNFEIENYYDYDKIQKMIEIIKKYKITETHIHTFVAMSVMFPACILSNVPYVSYVHTGVSVIEQTFDWFESQSEILKQNLKEFFDYSYKIIVINDSTKEYLMKKYEIKDDKIKYIRNSINFDEYKSSREIDKIKNVLILGRMHDIQLESRINGVLLFKELSNLYGENLKLRIAGDGPKREEIEELVKKENIGNVEFLGEISNVKEEINNSEIVIGVGRCILEAMAMKRIAVISSYKGMKQFVSKDNINTELDENFVGTHLEQIDIKELAKKIKELDKASINKIVNDNYKIIKERLDINNNIYTCDITNYKYDISDNLYKIMMRNSKNISDKLDRTINKMDNDWKEHLKYKEWMESREKNFEEQIQEQQRIIEELRKKEKRLDALEESRIIKKLEKIYEKRGIFDVNE